jgi:hypothetical protein
MAPNSCHREENFIESAVKLRVLLPWAASWRRVLAVWWGLVVRGNEREVPEVGPVEDQLTCLAALLARLGQLGYRGRVVAQHDKDWGCLVEGVRAEDGAAVQAIVWTSRYLSQGRLEIHFQRLGLLRSPVGLERVGLRRLVIA